MHPIEVCRMCGGLGVQSYEPLKCTDRCTCQGMRQSTGFIGSIVSTPTCYTTIAPAPGWFGRYVLLRGNRPPVEFNQVPLRLQEDGMVHVVGDLKFHATEQDEQLTGLVGYLPITEIWPQRCQAAHVPVGEIRSVVYPTVLTFPVWVRQGHTATLQNIRTSVK